MSACSSYTTVSSAPVYTIPAPKPSLAKIRAHYIHRLQTNGVQVAAYTDNNGHIERQQALTTRQAQVGASFLWSRGVNARLSYAVGYNRKNPVDYNGSSHGRFNNRSVEISFRFYPEYTFLTRKKNNDDKCRTIGFAEK